MGNTPCMRSQRLIFNDNEFKDIFYKSHQLSAGWILRANESYRSNEHCVQKNRRPVGFTTNINSDNTEQE